MADIFISYKRRMRPEVACLAEVLRALKLSVWFDAGLEPGSSFSTEIAQEVRAARVVLVCWTPDCFPKGGDVNGWVIGEASIGRARRQRGEAGYAPTYLEPCELDPPFNTDHVESLHGWFSREGERARHGPLTDPRFLSVLAVVARHVGRPGLADYVRARGSGDAAALTRWAQTHGEDPLAEEAWAEIELREADALKARLASEREKRLAREEEKPKLDWGAGAQPSPPSGGEGRVRGLKPAWAEAPKSASEDAGSGPPRWMYAAGAALAALIAVLVFATTLNRPSVLPREGAVTLDIPRPNI